MNGKTLFYSVNDIGRNVFHKCKKPVDANKVDVNKIVISDKDSYDKEGLFKCFIEYKNNEVVKPLCTKLLQMSGYVKCFHSNNRFMNSLVNGNRNG